jgi:hypothetical protein
VGRRTTRRPGRAKQTNRPSLFFIIALAVGLVLVLSLFIWSLSHAPKPKPKAHALRTVVQPPLS